MALIKRDDGAIVVQKDWLPTMIGSAYHRPGPMNCKVISWDMEKLQSSLLRKFRPNFRDRILIALRLHRL
jgi:hypothetical protein